ncbi:MAG TPA: Xaa-Pro peptidase family protein [Thermoleophilaceae bacterium]|nr:Xaa-Pro peptidase family protein [Thermoleophilaceae bacterium]
MSVGRADGLVQRMRERELDALLVTNLMNVRYLSGFTGTNGLCVVTPDERLFFTDFRYVERAASEVPDFERVRGRQDLLGDAAERLSGRVGFEDQHMSVRTHERLRGIVGEGVELVPAGGLVEELRAVKGPEELRAMREAAALADDMYEYLRQRGLVGRTEREVAVDVEREMRDRGAEDPSFPSIVAAGANGALPHAAPRDVAIEPNTLVIVDMGCLVDGYCSDCTRTFATGSLDDEVGSVYELVLAAQEESLAAVRAGADCKEVDSVARDRIAGAGYGERFGHGLGHGVGLEVHEAPRLAQTAEGSLVAGNAVTVEPGVYVPGAFGVRIEDLAVVTDAGSEVLSHFPKELITVGA